EAADAIAARVRKALKHVSAERLSLNPDCGFAPSGNNPIPLDEPYRKLKALAEAAAMLRKGKEAACPRSDIRSDFPFSSRFHLLDPLPCFNGTRVAAKFCCAGRAGALRSSFQGGKP